MRDAAQRQAVHLSAPSERHYAGKLSALLLQAVS